MPLICAAKAEEKIPTVSSNGSQNELALIRALYIHPYSTIRRTKDREIREEKRRRASQAKREKEMLLSLAVGHDVDL